ncbi:unnamed protein product [Cuscuta campestris]|uniref:Auxin-responsive protein n=1 Tax=Cuscuta campestris TaxID=132261 RepID=A0A484K4M9_9ASTE|nr:unnamed protein product [Cuscuta campestris]
MGSRAAAFSNNNDELIDNLNDTELRLGLPGRDDEKPQGESSQESRNQKKRSFSDFAVSEAELAAPPAPKAQVVGWPPVRGYRKNLMAEKEVAAGGGGVYVKVSMAGAPYLRKMDLKVYGSYPDLVKGLEEMFRCSICLYGEREGGYINFIQGPDDYTPTYEDKDGDWMLAGDVPWEMFVNNCKRLRVVNLNDLKL